MCLIPASTHLARALEAVFAITVLARLETAVITSASFSDVGGLSLTLHSFGCVTSHDGILGRKVSAQTSTELRKQYREKFLNVSRDAKPRWQPQWRQGRFPTVVFEDLRTLWSGRYQPQSEETCPKRGKGHQSVKRLKLIPPPGPYPLTESTCDLSAMFKISGITSSSSKNGKPPSVAPILP